MFLRTAWCLLLLVTTETETGDILNSINIKGKLLLKFTENGNKNVAISLLQVIIIATKNRAKMQGLAQVLKQEAFAIAKKVTTETTAKVSTI